MTKEEIRQLSHQWVSNLHGKEFNATSEEMCFQSYAYQDGYETGVKHMQESNEGEALLYAVNKTAERTKREVIAKAVEWMKNNLHEFSANVSYKNLFTEFKQAMEEEL